MNDPQVTDPETTARNRYFMIAGSRIAGVAGALFGLVLIGCAVSLEQRILGTAIVISAMIVMAIVPRSLAARWRTPPDA